jgi:histone H3/H4
MKIALPDNAKIAKEAKECMQECVSEFISFITSEGGSSIRYILNISLYALASEKCLQEKRKTVNGEDILFAMTSLGFENYSEALKIYLAKYRDVSRTPAKKTVLILTLNSRNLCETINTQPGQKVRPNLYQLLGWTAQLLGDPI